MSTCLYCGEENVNHKHFENCKELLEKENQKGLYNKFKVIRLNDLKNKHDDCEYFVLDWNHDKFAIPAMTAYANACEKEYPLLAQNIRARIEQYKS